MVERADLSRISTLYSEHSDVTLALANFDAGGRIITMTVGGAVVQAISEPEGEVGEALDLTDVTIDTSSWFYPEMMIEAIKQNLRTRQGEIVQALISLGVTGIDLPGGEPAAATPFTFPAAPAPAPPQPPPAPPQRFPPPRR
jgi:hypothetical protein